MTRRRWIADEVSGSRAFLIGEHARHLAQVLRAQVGQEFEISAAGEVRLGRISSVRGDRIEFELGEALTQPALPLIGVAISIFKFDRMEWAIEKCTELGVARVIPVIAGRTETHLASAAQKRVERWRRIAHQASEQSRQVAAPEISQPLRFNELVSMQSAVKIVLSELEDQKMLKHCLRPGDSPVLLAFGPEGGWKDQELAGFRDHGWSSASLGGKVLRAETAIIAALAIVASTLES